MEMNLQTKETKVEKIHLHEVKENDEKSLTENGATKYDDPDSTTEFVNVFPGVQEAGTQDNHQQPTVQCTI